MAIGEPVQDRPNLSPNTKRHIRRRIYLPLGIGLAAVFGLVIGLGLVKFGTVSVWADFSVFLLFFPAFLAGLLALGLIVICTYAVYQLMYWLLIPLGRARVFMARAAKTTRRGGNMIARPIIKLRSLGAAIESFLRGVGSIFSDSQG
jgi:hypothetical protein